MATRDFGWAVPVMRAGYAGRGLVYLTIAGFSLYAIWRGGEAKSTSSALEILEGSPGGTIVLVLLVLGLFAYFVWRVVCGFYDLEDYGSGGKGMVARTGMFVTGIIHAAIGVAALTVLIGTAGGGGGGSGGGGSKIAEYTGTVLTVPFGRWIVGLAGLATIGAGIYYLYKAWKRKYRVFLRANPVTINADWALAAGVAAQGVIVAIVGGFLVYAGIRGNSSEAGGVGKVFEWLSQQPFGQVLVTIICIGLLGFALFCFVNTIWRIVPKAREEGVEALAQRFKRKAQRAM